MHQVFEEGNVRASGFVGEFGVGAEDEVGCC